MVRRLRVLRRPPWRVVRCAAVVVQARDAEGVPEAVRQRAHHEQREEAIVLEHLAEIELGILG
jgi:hypothetical protein